MTETLKRHIAAQDMTQLNRRFKEQAVAEKARLAGLGYIDIEHTPIDADAIVVLSRKQAESAQILPYSLNHERLSVAVINPEKPETEAVITTLKQQGYKIFISLCSEEGLAAGFDINRDRYEAIDYFDTQQEKITQNDKITIDENIQDLNAATSKFSEDSAAKILAKVLGNAIHTGASDIHLERYEFESRLRFRLDGILHDIVHMTNENTDYLVKEIKYKSKMKLNVHTIPQDGRFFLRMGQRKIDIRVSLLPSKYGESFVMRILDEAKNHFTLEQIGFENASLEHIRSAIHKPQGLVLITGPTGSGKTTTLYSFLRELNQEGAKIITLEDPIEYEIPGVEQSEINESVWYTFASGLRSILRHDPDILLIGEIRDQETAITTTNAALTGHLVFSTLHTNSAIGAINRLVHMGVPMYILLPALTMVLGQRLVRTLCPECATHRPITEEEKAVFLSFGVTPPETVAEAQGCPHCQWSGYKGRAAVYETLILTPEIKKVLQSMEHIQEDRIIEEAKKQGFVPLFVSGLQMVARGQTSLWEIFQNVQTEVS